MARGLPPTPAAVRKRTATLDARDPAKYVVAFIPDIKILTIDASAGGFLLIASDGLWDFISSKRTV